MPLIIEYLIKFSIGVAVVYLFYQFLLRRLTFYNTNRWYLLGYVILCFVFPFINITPIVEKANIDSKHFIYYVPVLDKYTMSEVSMSAIERFLHPASWWNIVLFVLLTGSLVLLIRSCMQFISLEKMRKQAIKINQSDIAVYHIEKSIIPFSFGNNIYINKHMHTEKELEEIILHEFIHVKQKHTIDIVVSELLCIFNWYNPFAWLIRVAIKQNLEFIADHQVLQTGLDKKNYQYHLLKVTGMPQYGIASNFNFSSLKKRITMMNKMKTAKVQLLRFLFILPLVAIVLLAFRNRSNEEHVNKLDFGIRSVANDSIPQSGGDSLAEKILGINQNGPYVDVRFNDGKLESYNLQNESERKVYEKKYKNYLERRKKEQEKFVEEMKNYQLQQDRLTDKQKQELLQAQHEIDLESEKLNAERLNMIQKKLLDDNLRNQELSMIQSDEDLKKILKSKLDSSYDNELNQYLTAPPAKILLEEAESNYLDLVPVENLDKESLKKLQKRIQIQQNQLHSNMQELELKQKKIEKQLKLKGDKVS